MREIKFRAWEKDLKEIIPVDDINFQRRQVNTQHVWRFFEEVELMQFTGLKDKNGKEIYEGDIVTSEEYPFMDEGEFNYHAVIEWDDETAAFIRVFRLVNPNKRGISDGIAELIDNPDELIVIGNIYESEDNK